MCMVITESYNRYSTSVHTFGISRTNMLIKIYKDVQKKIHKDVQKRHE